MNIPAEARARQARLTQALAAMAQGADSREPLQLQALRGGSGDPEALVLGLAEADLLEEGQDLLRTLHRSGVDPHWLTAVAARLAPLAAKARLRREAGWQLDSRRTTVRIRYAKEVGALDFDDGDLHALFLSAFRLEGLPLAFDLGKRPRPMLRLELPLPAGALGDAEWLEAVLRAEPREPVTALLARLNARLPDGLRLQRWEVHPSFVSPLGELAETSHWRWSCPRNLLAVAQQRSARFLAAVEFPWEKGGKVEGQKQEKRIDLRPLVKTLQWEGDTLLSVTRQSGAEGSNPLKVHAAILGLEPLALRGLTRVGLDFRPDPRAAQAERYQPKLKNIYEDAVLLAGGSNIILVDEDDDEPIRLG